MYKAGFWSQKGLLGLEAIYMPPNARAYTQAAVMPIPSPSPINEIERRTEIAKAIHPQLKEGY
jgi:hypothetical protein